jgi:alpha-ribazole phosphatase
VGGFVIRFWWIRHAPVLGEKGVLPPGDAPADVGDGAMARALGAELPAEALAVTSGMRRAAMTATALGLSDPMVEPDLAEQDFGDWTGCRHDDLWAVADSEYRAFWRDPAHGVPPNGESFAAVMVRVAGAVARLEAAATESDTGDVVCVVHAGTVRAALAAALDLSPDAALRFVIDPWSLTRIDWRPGAAAVRMVNRLA